jgi:hypothetical protein
MAKEEISAKTKKEDGTVVAGSGEYDFGDNLAGATKLFTEQVVFDYFRAHARVVVQAGIRAALEAGQDLKSFLASYKLGTKVARITDPIAAAKAKFATMSKEEKAAFLKALSAMG